VSGEWKVLCATAEALPGEMLPVFLEDVALLVVNHDGQFYVIEDQCTHDSYELSSGRFDPETMSVECAYHGAQFDVRSGEALCPPAYEPVRKFPVKVEDGLVYVQIDG
jgi:3-phenylpropionate/trans-cinnamate dioxygenase ferredoxin subunit